MGKSTTKYNALASAEISRHEANRELDPEIKSKLGQFMTPDRVASFMAGLFISRSNSIRLLDAGAGVGSLSLAFIEHWGANRIDLTAYEIDTIMVKYLRKNLDRYQSPSFSLNIIVRDFIEDAADTINKLKGGTYSHAILNPPYKKINSESSHRLLLRSVGLETVNLYSAFLGLVIELMASGGEIVAIIPRSFCNGLYFKPFREWMLKRAAIEHLHLFHSRTSAFNDDNVLQENIIIKLVRNKLQGPVQISISSDSSFNDIKSFVCPFAQIVNKDDLNKFIHIPVDPTHGGLETIPLAKYSLNDINIEVSTGPVVDFRLREYLRAKPEKGTVPLLYATHFVKGHLEWPRDSKKPNAMVLNSATRKWLFPRGYYTVVRRFSSKEEKKRIVAYVIEPDNLAFDQIGFENHLNIFHSKHDSLQRDVAYGLATYLNSTAVDSFFRRFSGHTQVNATDLRNIKYPDIKVLERLGRWSRANRSTSQITIDSIIGDMNGRCH